MPCTRSESSSSAHACFCTRHAHMPCACRASCTVAAIHFKSCQHWYSDHWPPRAGQQQHRSSSKHAAGVRQDLTVRFSLGRRSSLLLRSGSATRCLHSPAPRGSSYTERAETRTRSSLGTPRIHRPCLRFAVMLGWCGVEIAPGPLGLVVLEVLSSCADHDMPQHDIDPKDARSKPCSETRSETLVSPTMPYAYRQLGEVLIVQARRLGQERLVADGGWEGLAAGLRRPACEILQLKGTGEIRACLGKRFPALSALRTLGRQHAETASVT